MHIIMSDNDNRTGRRRRAHSEALKIDLVARSLEPGASVSAIALEAGINANLLFAWRRAQLRSSAAAATLPAPNPREVGAVLLPVEIVPPRPDTPTVAAGAAPRVAPGSIEIDIGGARIRLRGAVDEASLRSVLQALRERA